ncbi:MAG TPA: type V CRISPR-associated protein Cas4 [Spirochaetota bacterium]|nr:type V CRISPR-associated protein Cas4 [Caldisericia bacterium]HRU64542.1 type V CRISPR-associated protein Cas4 [Spirochaetota bacterium]
MESYIAISMLNDFIFCPRSIYFHQVYGSVEQNMYHSEIQINGKSAHESIDNRGYSTRKDVLMGIEVFCEKYNLVGKIDIFDINSGKLIERKNRIVKIYDGYVFQLYGQLFALREMGYTVNQIILYDKSHNKNYIIPLPEADQGMFLKFERVIDDINTFDLSWKEFKPNAEKCKNCIYANLCDYCLC